MIFIGTAHLNVTYQSLPIRTYKGISNETKFAVYTQGLLITYACKISGLKCECDALQKFAPLTCLTLRVTCTL